MGNRPSEDDAHPDDARSGDDALPPAGADSAEEERCPSESPEDPRPELAELRQLLALADTCEPDMRVGVIGQIFELLLTPEWVELLAAAPALRETAILKAYEFSEYPALAWPTQCFLMEYHPEAFAPGGEGPAGAPADQGP